MKKRALIIVAGMLVCSVPAFCLFGVEDTIEFGPLSMAQVIAEVTQLINIYSQSKKAYSNFNEAIHFVESPGGWKTILTNEVASVGSNLAQASRGNDDVALRQILEGNKSALQAITQTLNNPAYSPTAENSAVFSLLHETIVQHTIEANQLQSALQSTQLRKVYRSNDPGFQGQDAWDTWSFSNTR